LVIISYVFSVVRVYAISRDSSLTYLVALLKDVCLIKAKDIYGTFYIIVVYRVGIFP